MRPFQIVLISIFGALALGGLFFLTVYQGGTTEVNPYGTSVEIWGTFDARVFNEVLAKQADVEDAFSVVTYREKDPATFDTELVHAIAEGRSPDLVFLGHEQLVQHRSKLFPISYESLPRRTIRDTYIDGVEIFARNDGVYGIPIAVDPFMLYWNRDIFANGGLSVPPSTWEQLVSETVPALTKKNVHLDVLQSAVALGEYANIRYAKRIVAMLLLQSGSSIVDEADGVAAYNITLQQGVNGVAPAQAALSFYTQFALPTHGLYSWNRSITEDHYQFIAGQLALYFAPGSMYHDIKKENPNLNFDITRVPQGSGATIKRNYGDFYALAIPKASDNIRGAYLAAWVMGNAAHASHLASSLNMSPVHRSVLAEGTNDVYHAVLQSAALIARGWLDPNPVASTEIFKQMVEDVTSGRLRVHASITDAVKRLGSIF